MHHRNTVKTIFKQVAAFIFTKHEDNAGALLVSVRAKLQNCIMLD
ncbi:MULTISPECIES: hypothetical protein [Alteromonas]|nr:hypothetical protein [Alteromonas sp. MmMcT2-5]